jgi:hypothetical protein
MKIKWVTLLSYSCNNSVYRAQAQRKHSLKNLEYVSYFDNKVTPADFFRFVNGTWFEKLKFRVIEFLGSFNELLKKQIKML